MQIPEFLRKWRAEAEKMRQRGVLVSGAVLCDEMLNELEAALGGEAEQSLSLKEAAEISGYSGAHLARLVRQGTLPDLRPPGTTGRIRVRRADLPVKPRKTHTLPAGVHELASRLFGGKEAKNGRP
jgi:hypothetical protein